MTEYECIMNILQQVHDAELMSAKTTDQLIGTCLRMLFAEKLQPAVQTVLNEKGKIEFHISIAADQEVFEELNERYKIMIS